MSYTYTLPKSTSFSGVGLEGYCFGPLRQKDLEVFYVQSEKGHDTFMTSRKITRTYYILSGSGYFTIGDLRYEVSQGMLVEVPPKVEYSYSGKMTLLGIASPRWFSGNDTHTRWNPAVTQRDSSSLPGRESWLTRLVRLSIAGKSPVHFFLKVNRRLWYRLPSYVSSRKPARSYGTYVHALARKYDARQQAFSTCFLRNRPELELISRLLEKKSHGERLRVAVLGCSLGAEAYSIAWKIRSVRPDLQLTLNAVDISRQAVEFARRGVYSLASSDVTNTDIFERMTAAEKQDFFDMDGATAAVKPWIKEAIKWSTGDVGEPDVIEALGPQDIVVASNFLCHMSPPQAESCLVNIARLVNPWGHLFVSGIDLDVRAKVAGDLGWKPVHELLEQIHNGDPCLLAHWPWSYAGLEPFDKNRRDWQVRYAAAFQVVPSARSSSSRTENEKVVAVSNS